MLYDTDDDPTARWARHVDLGSEWVELSDGRFRVEIHHHPASRRVMVTVPDGQIDHLGTIFDVMISRGSTTHVRVVEGRVAMHLRGRADVVLAAGECWDRPVAGEPDEASGSAGAPSAAAADTSGAGARASDSATASPSRAKKSGRPLGLRPLVPEATTVDQAAEDAAYLTVLRLLRASRAPEAKAAAREYLRRFPDGFRRQEMSALIK